MYHLINMFNRTIISSHRTEGAARKADVKHQRAVKRANGQNSYIPTQILSGRRAEVVERERLL